MCVLFVMAALWSSPVWCYLKHPRMLPVQFVTLYKTFKPKPNLIITLVMGNIWQTTFTSLQNIVKLCTVSTSNTFNLPVSHIHRLINECSISFHS